ncbi:hypothetical protein E3E12_05435 [Formicincola oecophyllae]|uniref:Uncharacterized protein n=1 Tax=Formicincola oecophyllae TaxID=2558361 RepID=A0A4Y6U8F2_9PROT|nr:hypothetical protein [Formicincola oecophyllae]QDH13723.2 hypothetical protein E3E12_05435 [Formicincola oecophyllae]
MAPGIAHAQSSLPSGVGVDYDGLNWAVLHGGTAAQPISWCALTTHGEALIFRTGLYQGKLVHSLRSASPQWHLKPSQGASLLISHGPTQHLYYPVQAGDRATVTATLTPSAEEQLSLYLRTGVVPQYIDPKGKKPPEMPANVDVPITTPFEVTILTDNNLTSKPRTVDVNGLQAAWPAYERCVGTLQQAIAPKPTR